MTPIFVHAIAGYNIAVRMEDTPSTHENPVLINLDLVARIYALESGGCKLEFLSGPALLVSQSIHDLIAQRTAQLQQDAGLKGTPYDPSR